MKFERRRGQCYVCHIKTLPDYIFLFWNNRCSLIITIKFSILIVLLFFISKNISKERKRICFCPCKSWLPLASLLTFSRFLNFLFHYSSILYNYTLASVYLFSKFYLYLLKSSTGLEQFVLCLHYFSLLYTVQKFLDGNNHNHSAPALCSAWASLSVF